MLKSATACAAVVAFCSAATLGFSAAADTIDKSGQPSLTLRVAGEIQQHCKLDQIEGAALGDLTRPSVSSDTVLGLDCNVPFSVGLVAVNGGLRNVQHPDGLGPYAGSRGYTLTFDVPVQQPVAKTIEARFSSRDLAAGQSVSSEGGVAFNGAHIHLDLDPVASPGLAAGQYSETIELSIAPSV